MHPNERNPSRLLVRSRGFATSVEAAKFLGVTRQHVAKLIRDGEIPAVRFGKSLRIPWRWLLQKENCGADRQPAA